jgi:hypothetical protein
LFVIVAAVSIGASAAFAGPICEDRAGEAVRCEDPRAMPFGWTLPPDERFKNPHAEQRDPTVVELAGVLASIALLFALIALMPDFEGWAGGGSETEANKSGEQDPVVTYQTDYWK